MFKRNVNSEYKYNDPGVTSDIKYWHPTLPHSLLSHYLHQYFCKESSSYSETGCTPDFCKITCDFS